MSQSQLSLVGGKARSFASELAPRWARTQGVSGLEGLLSCAASCWETLLQLWKLALLVAGRSLGLVDGCHS